VIGRQVEQAVLNRIVAEARARGIRRLIGIYRPTERNGMVNEHYAKLGFTRADASAPGEERWELDVSAFTAFDVPIATPRDLMAA
jgi:predicted enzyme involved in methoxymalonyl-ACP biosynthesis